MAGGLLGYAASMGQGINSLADWLEERARFAGGRVKRLATDPVGLLGTMAGEAGKSFTDFADAAARGDTQATVEGLLNSGLAGPLTFAGVGAKTADKVALQKAKQMANLGEDPVKIWQTTGWTEQFPDRKWRFEISDHNAYIPGKANESISNVMENARFGEVPRLKSVYKHPALEAAYPDFMQNTRINDFPADVMGGAQGSYRAPSNMQVASGLSVRDALPVIAHEGQHGIQGVEGFARGGSPEGLPQALQQDVSELRKAARKAFDADKRDVGMALEEKARQLEHMAMWGEGAPYELYKRLAGEAEARLTQSRMNLTPAERMQHPPWLPGPYGFDVPPEQQIVRGLLGEQTGPAMQTVYHGTPHKFDRYDLSKIGTGEGAQAYGHGMYFAENPGVAKTYAESLAENVGYNNIDAFLRKHYGVNRSADEIKALLPQDPQLAKLADDPRAVQALKELLPGYRPNLPVTDKELNAYRRLNDVIQEKYKGVMLKQDLPDEVLPKMLQWDKPLSEQPESVKKALDKAPFEWRSVASQASGSDLLDMAGRYASGGMKGRAWSSQYKPQEAAALLRSLGIPGVSYLDAGSRSGGKGTMNHVVWDQELLDRMKPEPVGGLLGQQ